MSVIVSHNAGFFSCCSVKLDNIISFINSNKTLPTHVDSSVQFSWYKINKTGDITYDYFEDYNKHNINYNFNTLINYYHYYQYYDYTLLQYEKMSPIIDKYFSPSEEIKKYINEIELKYKLNYSNICVLFYRGNDKNSETPICGYDEYIHKATEIMNAYPKIQFLIQSDETEFIEKMRFMFPDNSFYFKDEVRHMPKCDNTVDIVMREQNHIFSKYYLAITIIMSKCQYIVCGSGNCSIWIMLYRKNNKNVCQNLNNIWISNIDL